MKLHPLLMAVPLLLCIGATAEAKIVYNNDTED